MFYHLKTNHCISYWSTAIVNTITQYSYETTYITTHDSESQGQEEITIMLETKIMQPLSELFTRKTVHKLSFEAS